MRLESLKEYNEQDAIGHCDRKTEPKREPLEAALPLSSSCRHVEQQKQIPDKRADSLFCAPPADSRGLIWISGRATTLCSSFLKSRTSSAAVVK